MKQQPCLGLYGKGIQKTKSGHLRYTSPKELRGEYVHRKVIADLVEETCWSIKLLLPWPYEVHHMDYNKENNSPANLLLLSTAFHAALTADRPRGNGGKFGNKFRARWKPAPEWILFDEENGNTD